MAKLNPGIVLSNAKTIVSSKVQSINIKPEEMLLGAARLPGVRIDRTSFMKKELGRLYPEDVVENAIKKNPAYAGIKLKDIDRIATHCINYETNKASAISFATGIPGAAAAPAMAALVTADVTQYFAFVLRIMQKLAYLYGFEELNLTEEDIDDETMGQLMVFLGIMFGVQQANAAVKILADASARKVSKSLAQKALTKGVVYPVVKKVSQQVGVKMTKQVFAEGVSKVVPVIGGAVTGGMTYFSFKPCSNKLKNSFRQLPICDPDFYKDGGTVYQ